MKNELNIVDGKETEFDLDFHIHSLLQDEPFFARVSRYVSKKASYDIPTAGVRINGEKLSFELIYNPKFFLSLPKEHRKGVLMHEFYHIALAHCTGRKKEGVSHKIQNIAMDLAINSLPNMTNMLPDLCCFPGKGPFEKLPSRKTFEWYLKELLKMQEEQKKEKGKGQGEQDQGQGDGMPEDSFDSHDGWMEENDSDSSMDNAKEVARQRMKDVIQKAAEESDKAEASGNGRGWGSVSNEIKRLIKESHSHKLDPKAIFAYFCKTSVKSNRKSRITKINRRWAYIHPGRAWERRAKIAIAVDQSGSVNDEMLQKVYGWMNELSKFCEFVVVPFDDRVFEEKVFTWKKGQKKTKERVLNGGTNFNAPTEWANKSDVDALVIFTDMCAGEPKRCKLPRLWITDQYHAQRPYFTPKEKMLVID